MSGPGRKLSPGEAALWARVARTVAPMEGRPKIPLPSGEENHPRDGAKPAVPRPVAGPPRQRPALPPFDGPRSGSSPRGEDPGRRMGLDSSWERKLARGLVQPDFTLDLHGASLDAAYTRLMQGLSQAWAMGARVVLVITGKPRTAEAADRGWRRGAIRAKLIDWLAQSEHAGRIAAIRNAHRRHGGQGAIYVILKKGRG